MLEGDKPLMNVAHSMNFVITVVLIGHRTVSPQKELKLSSTLSTVIILSQVDEAYAAAKRLGGA